MLPARFLFIIQNSRVQFTVHNLQFAVRIKHALTDVRAHHGDFLLPLPGGEGRQHVTCRAERRSAGPNAVRSYIAPEAHQPGARMRETGYGLRVTAGRGR